MPLKFSLLLIISYIKAVRIIKLKSGRHDKLALLSFYWNLILNGKKLAIISVISKNIMSILS